MALKLFLKLQNGFGRLKEHLNIPAHAVNLYNFLFEKRTVGAKNSEPTTLFISVLNEYNL